VDAKCTDLGSTWPEGPPPSEGLPSVSLNQVPTTWKVNTMQTVELAVQQHQVRSTPACDLVKLGD
jgi:hypothetical protein